MDERANILASLAPLFDKARAEGLWFWSSYQDMWFSPDELAKLQAQGSFVWGVANWKLRDPHEYLAEANERVQAAIRNRDRILQSIADYMRINAHVGKVEAVSCERVGRDSHIGTSGTD